MSTPSSWPISSKVVPVGLETRVGVDGGHNSRVGRGNARDRYRCAIQDEVIISDNPHVEVANLQDVLIFSVELEVEEARRRDRMVFDGRNVQRPWPVRDATRLVDDRVARLAKGNLEHGRIDATIHDRADLAFGKAGVQKESHALYLFLIHSASLGASSTRSLASCAAAMPSN